MELRETFSGIFETFRDFLTPFSTLFAIFCAVLGCDSDFEAFLNFLVIFRKILWYFWDFIQSLGISRASFATFWYHSESFRFDKKMENFMIF